MVKQIFWGILFIIAVLGTVKVQDDDFLIEDIEKENIEPFKSEESRKPNKKKKINEERKLKLKACGKMVDKEIKGSEKKEIDKLIEQFGEDMKTEVTLKAMAMKINKCVKNIDRSMAEYYYMGYVQMEGMDFVRIDYKDFSKEGFDLNLSYEEFEVMTDLREIEGKK